MAKAKVAPIMKCKKCGIEKPHNKKFFANYYNRSGKVGLRHACRKCTNVWSMVRYERENDKLLAQMKAWRKANPNYERERWPKRREKASQYKKRRWAAMTDDERAEHRRKVKKWHLENPEKSRAIEKRRLERQRTVPAEREKERARQNRWLAENPLAATARRDRRRARKQAAKGDYTPEDALWILNEQSGLCFYCDSQLEDYHCDHFIPLSQGGSNEPENIRISCPSCNYSKGGKMPWDWMPERFLPPD